jgi:hypothetical protein
MSGKKIEKLENCIDLTRKSKRKTGAEKRTCDRRDETTD